jgi:hypothetical protein
MATLTNNLIAEIEREKDFTPEEMLAVLRKRDNFLTVSVGIKRELHRLGYTGGDMQLLADFCALMKDKDLNSSEFRQEKKWFADKALPSPEMAIRLCFAFGLSGQSALDFLWKTCRVNGFNFRRARDVVFCYCLENGNSCEYAAELMKRYEQQTIKQTFEPTDYTKRTHVLRSVFGKLAGMSETEFFDKLCANKKNFIGYSLTAHEEFASLRKSLTATIENDIDEHHNDHKYTLMDKYDSKPFIYAEIVYAFDRIIKAAKDRRTTLGDIATDFPKSRYLTEIFKTPEAATDKEHDKARKAFVLLYFANYALDPPPDKFYNDFVYALNDALDRCGYGKLYPANPFDWLILNCIRSIDYVDTNENLNPVELFNDVLELLAADSESLEVQNG